MNREKMDLETWKLLRNRTDFDVLKDPLSSLDETGVKRPSVRKVWKKLPDVKVVDGILVALKEGIYRSPEIAERLGVTNPTITRHRAIIRWLMARLNEPGPPENKFTYIDLTKGEDWPHPYFSLPRTALDEEHGLFWIQKEDRFCYSFVYPEIAKAECPSMPIIMAPAELLKEIEEAEP